MLIDSHAHLQDPLLLPDLEDVLARALAVGVQAIICPGYDLESSRQAIKLAEKYAPVWAAVGLHPVSYTHLDVYKRQVQLYPTYDAVQ